jgi:glycosyltransferase involved in cell wall biosynthesis
MLNAEVITVPESEEMYKYVPVSDVVIATYFLNAHELKKINAPLKIYFAQGDQYAFNDELLMKQCKKDSVSAQNKTLSKESYHIDDVKVIANSEGFAELLKRNYSRVPDAILNVGVDRKVFCSLQKSYEGSTKRILVVGPDNYGTQLEPLHFKGMDDVKAALKKLKGKYPNFTLVRVSNTTPEIFKDFECEFYYLPNDELKKYLYGTADILIYASHYESLGLPPLEAMAAGTAVICTNNVGSREYCHNGENSLLVNTKSPEEILQALLKLLRDKDLSDKIINGGKFTSLLYTKEREIEKLENIIYDFLAEKGLDVIDTNAVGKNLFSANFDEAFKLVNEYISNKNFKDAMTQLDFIEKEISEGNGNGIDYLEVVIYLKGVCHLLSGNIEEAKSLFEQLLNINPASSSACYGLGQIFFSTEQYEAAKTMFEWAVKNDTGNQQAMRSLKEVNKLLGFEVEHSSLTVESNG